MNFLPRTVAVLASVCLSVGGARGSTTMRWDEIAVLPCSPDEKSQAGQAGAFSGVHDNALLIAGGANFPHGSPWDGGPKVWWDDIFILERKAPAPVPETTEAQPGYEWAGTTGKLPRALAYGVSISLQDGVLCIGGCDAQRCYPDVFLLQWNATTQSIGVTEFPPLPKPLAFMSGALAGEKVFVTGGQETMNPGAPTASFFCLDLSKRAAGGEDFRWEDLPPWDGAPRVLPVVAAQTDGETECLYLFSGRNPRPDEDTEILTDAHKFNPATGSWTKLDDVRGADNQPICVMAAAATVPPNGTEIVVFGGADGVVTQMLEHNGRKARSENSEEAEAFTKFNMALLEHHPGFSRDILSYDTVKKTWSKVGVFPGPVPVTTPAVRWGDDVIIPTGEVQPGVRSPKIWKGKFDLREE